MANDTDKIIELTDDNFDSVVTKANTLVLVDFWASWCGPCKAIAPILDELAEELEGKVRIGKVDVDAYTDLAGKFQVRQFPTLLIFKNGVVIDKVIGLTSKPDLSARLQALA